jgi:hypothetical protein
MVAAPSSLLLQLELQDDVDCQQMENVVKEHLRRLANGEEVNLRWRRR